MKKTIEKINSVLNKYDIIKNYKFELLNKKNSVIVKYLINIENTTEKLNIYYNKKLKKYSYFISENDNIIIEQNNCNIDDIIDNYL